MPRIDSITPAQYDAQWPYHAYYDNLPLKYILARQDLINNYVDSHDAVLGNSVGTSGTLANRLNQSINPDGTLISTAIDAAGHSIEEHEDTDDYVRMTAAERDKLDLVSDSATALKLEFDTISATNLFDDQTVIFANSDTITWNVDSPNYISANMTFPSTIAHEHHDDIVPVHANLSTPDYTNYKATSLSTAFVEGSLRVYVNGIKLSSNYTVYVYNASSGPSGSWQLTSFTEDAEAGTFALNRALSSSDHIIIEFDRSLTEGGLGDGPSLSSYILSSSINQPSGVAGLDGDGNLVPDIISYHDTEAAIDALTLDEGFFAWTTDTKELRVGDGTTVGGIVVGRTSNSTIYLEAKQTALLNGEALRAAYEAAALLTPNGAAISSSNMAFVHAGPGVYDITGGGDVHLELDVAYVGIIGSGPYTTIVVTNSTNHFRLRAYHVLKNLGITSTNSTAASFQFNGTLNFLHEDLNIIVPVATDSGIGNSLTSGNTIAGTARRVTCNGIIYGGGTTVHTIHHAMTIEDCYSGAAARSFGAGGTSLGLGTNSSTIRRTRMPNLTAGWFSSFTGTMDNCEWGNTIWVGSGAKIRYTKIAPPSSAKCIDAAGAVNVQVVHCSMKSFAAACLGTNATNLIGTPMNVEDDDFSL